jgi:transposase
MSVVNVPLERKVVDYLKKNQDGKSLSEIAKRFKLTRHSVRKIARKYNIELITKEELLYGKAINGLMSATPVLNRAKPRRKKKDEPFFTEEDKEYMEKNVHRLSLTKISENLNIPVGRVTQYLDEVGLRKIQRKSKQAS